MATAEAHLIEANRHIKDAERHIEKQRDVVDRCATRGLDSLRAKELLQTMQQALDTMQRHRQTILSELGQNKRRRHA